MSQKDRDRGSRDGKHDKQVDSSTVQTAGKQIFGGGERKGNSDYKRSYDGARGKQSK